MTEDHKIELINLGQNMLNTLRPIDDIQSSLKTRLIEYCSSGFIGLEDSAGWLSCVLALTSVIGGNYGIGAVILDKNGKVIVYGHNQICKPYFRSDAHAEMVVLSEFEEKFQNRRKDDLVLYTSLEPCPMCYVRILTSGIPTIFHVAPDDPGGMVQRAEILPEYWRSMAGKHCFSQANIRQELRNISLDILYSNINHLDANLQLRPVK